MEVSFTTLPRDVLAYILALVGQSDLAALASTNSQLYEVATDLLYHSILVVPQVIVSAEYNYSFSEYTSRVRSVTGYSYVGSIAQTECLAEALSNRRLVEKIVHFHVQPQFTDPGMICVCARIHKLLQSDRDLVNSTGRFHDLNRTLYGLGELKQQKQSSTYRVVLDLENLVVSAPISATMAHLEVGMKNARGLDVLRSFRGNLAPHELTISHFHNLGECGGLEQSEQDGLMGGALEVSLEMENGQYGESLENQSGIGLNQEIQLDEYRREGHTTNTSAETCAGALDFSLLRSIDICTLSSLHLHVSCGDDTETMDLCSCFRDFMLNFGRFLAGSNGLPNLQELEICVLPQGEWIQPHHLLDAVLTPVSSAVSTLSKLQRFRFGLSSSTLKMYDESGMSLQQLNSLNCRLVEAFFLSLQPHVLQTLTHLELPDFLMAFLFYKPNFMESLLHACKCTGCAQTLGHLSSYVPLDENGNVLDRNCALYVMVGFILDKLHDERQLVKPPNHTGTVEHCTLYPGVPCRIQQVVASIAPTSGVQEVAESAGEVEGVQTSRAFELGTTSCGNLEVSVDSHVESAHTQHPGPNALHPGFCTRREQHFKEGETSNVSCRKPADADDLVTTYILHQVRPVVEFLAAVFPNLDHLMVHGLHFEKRGSCFSSVFDPDSYPELGNTDTVDCGGTFGHFGLSTHI